MNFVNRICPKCNNPNYVVSLGNFSNAFKYKCMNCNSYLLEEDFGPVQKDDNNGWISVKDRLPERFGEEYIVYITSNDGEKCVTCDHFVCSSRKHWFLFDGAEAVVTHWQPLPEPPKEETDD